MRFEILRRTSSKVFHIRCCNMHMTCLLFITVCIAALGHVVWKTAAFVKVNEFLCELCNRLTYSFNCFSARFVLQLPSQVSNHIPQLPLEVCVLCQYFCTILE